MNQAGFEKRVLELWVTTRIPLTRANVQYLTGAKRGQVDKWLDQLVAGGILDVDADDDGEMLWAVRGAKRSTGGPATVEELDNLDRLRAEAGAERDGLAGLKALAGGAAGSLVRAASSASRSRGARSTGALPSGDGEARKSLIASGLLSFFFGPLGWLYAAPLKEAAPAAALYLIAYMLIPHFLLVPLLGLLQPISALAGVGYALKFNSNGRRTPLLGSGDDDAPKRLPPRR